MAVVGTAGRGLIIYQLENQPQEFKRVDSPLKYQVRYNQREEKHIFKKLDFIFII